MCFQLSFINTFLKKTDKSENYCFSYQWDTCLSLLAKSNVLVWYDPSFLLQTGLQFRHAKSVAYRSVPLSSLVSCRCFCFGEGGPLSSRDVPRQKRFADGEEQKPTAGVGDPAPSPGCGGSCELGMSTNAWRCGQRWRTKLWHADCRLVCHPLLPFTT